MKTFSFSTFMAVGVSSLFLTANIASSQILFSDNFDGFASPSEVTASGTANGYKIDGRLSESATPTVDFKVIFGFDYSTVTDAAVIPSAPNSIGGTTKGLYVTANKNDASSSIRAAVSLYPVGQSFSGDYSLKFDLWQNWGSGATLAASAEQTLFGINHSGTANNPIYFSGRPETSDGLFFSMSANGTVPSADANLRDFGVYLGTGAAAAALQTAGFTSQLGANFDNADAGFQTLFPARPAFPNLVDGSPGEQWVQGEVTQVGGVISWYLNGTLIAEYANSTAYTSGDIMLGYWDYLATVGNANNFAIFDNIVVSVVPEPSVLALGGIGVMGFFLRRRKF